LLSLSTSPLTNPFFQQIGSSLQQNDLNPVNVLAAALKGEGFFQSRESPLRSIVLRVRSLEVE
jgi:hypothetical protein